MNEAQVVKDHTGMMKAIVWSFRGCGVDQEDLEQEAALALVLAARTWRPDRTATLSTYAFRQIVWALCNAARGARRMRRLGRTASLDATLSDGESTLHDVVGEPADQDTRCDDATIRAAIASLPAEERDVLLRHMREEPVRAIATARGVSKTSVHETLTRGLELLRERLAA